MNIATHSARKAAHNIAVIAKSAGTELAREWKEDQEFRKETYDLTAWDAFYIWSAETFGLCPTSLEELEQSNNVLGAFWKPFEKAFQAEVEYQGHPRVGFEP